MVINGTRIETEQPPQAERHAVDRIERMDDQTEIRGKDFVTIRTLSWTGASPQAYAQLMAAGTKSGSVEWLLLIALGCLIALIVYTAR